MTLSDEEARQYLNSLINRNLRIYVSDSRIFVGAMKCTDNERNIILSQAFEYRPPPPDVVDAAAAEHARQGRTDNFVVDMSSRFMGLIVIPGRHIVKIEAE